MGSEQQLVGEQHFDELEDDDDVYDLVQGPAEITRCATQKSQLLDSMVGLKVKEFGLKVARLNRSNVQSSCSACLFRVMRQKFANVIRQLHKHRS